MKIALVHDFLSQDGGAERVLQAFHEIFPEAPIFVLFHDKESIDRFHDADVRESFLARFPGGRKKYQWFLPLMPLATERHDLVDFDVVLSSCSAFAKGVLTRPRTVHISYCHTPTRYLWTDSEQYIADLKRNFLVKAALPRLMHHLRLWDKMSTDRVDYFVANSNTVRQRISKFYRRDSEIIYPPVDVNNFYISEKIEKYFVTGGRLVPYKQTDLVVKTFNRLGWPLKVFGSGPELENLKRMAKSNIEFLGRISDKEKAQVLSQARAFIHPQIEDFGITSIEAMASGRPVIAFSAGGATETVTPNKTGLFFSEQTWESLFQALIEFDKMTWRPEEIKIHASRYSTEKFKDRIKKFVEQKYQQFKSDSDICQLPL